MSRRGPWSGGICVLAAVVVGGCGGGTTTPGAESGQYAGRDGGLGALIDYRASDPVATRLREAVKARGLRVAVAYLVNHSDRPVLVPTVVAERFDGQLSVMSPAARDPRLAPMVPAPPTAIGGNGAATVYLLTRERSEAVTSITLRLGDRTVTLSPQSGG